MKQFFDAVIKHRKKILFLFFVLCILGAICQSMVGVNYNLNDYLPEKTPSTVALNTLETEFEGGIPNARVMIYDLDLAEALEFRRLGVVISKIMIPLACVFVLIIVPSYLASTNNSYYYGSSHIFGEGTQLGDDTKAIEAIFGKNDTYVLMVPKGPLPQKQKRFLFIYGQSRNVTAHYHFFSLKKIFSYPINNAHPTP